MGIFALASTLIMSRLCIVSVNFSEFPSQHIFLRFLSPGGTTSRPRDVVPCPPNPSADPGRPPSARIRDWSVRGQTQGQPTPAQQPARATREWWHCNLKRTWRERPANTHRVREREWKNELVIDQKKGQNVLCASYSTWTYKLDSEMRRNAIHNTRFCNLSVATSGAGN